MTLKSSRSFLNPAQLKRISESVTELLPHSYCIIYADNIVVLINHDQPSCLDFQETQKLNHLLMRHQLSAGLSNSDDRIIEIARLYRQSLMALDMGNMLGLTGKLFTFCDHRLSSMLYAFVKLGDTESYISPAIRQLREYDQKKGAALLPTLTTYLKSNCKQLKAANDLFIQRGTLLYRLKKIEEMCQLDLNDPHTIFDLQLSLNIDQFLKQLNGLA